MSDIDMALYVFAKHLHTLVYTCIPAHIMYFGNSGAIESQF